MFVLGNFLQAVASILNSVLQIYTWVLIISVMISWVSPDPYNPVVRFLRGVSEPLFAWVRERLPFAIVGTLDLSPIIVILFLSFLRSFLVGTLLDLAVRLR